MVKAPGAAQGLSTLRPLNSPEHVNVQAKNGWPSTLQVRGAASREIASIEDVWRVEEEWWRDAPVVRTYFEVLLDTGRRMAIFFDHGKSSWYSQRHG